MKKPPAGARSCGPQARQMRSYKEMKSRPSAAKEDWRREKNRRKATL